MGNITPSELLEKYLKGNCTPEEKLLVEQALEETARDDREVYSEDMLQHAIETSWTSINTKTINKKSVIRRLIPYTAAAASIAIVIVATLYVVRGDKAVSPVKDKISVVTDVPPGGNRATLSLPGEQIILDSNAQGQLKNVSNITVNLRKPGEVVFTASTFPEPAAIETPNGGQFVVRLPDGTKVWLNAASSLKFPTSFAGQSDRRVTVSGEAYFEVAKNERQPFIVVTPTQEVRVLGTHFNINSYPDEPAVRTTLLEGAVRIFSTRLNTNLSEILKPGQMALHQGNKITVLKADENATAWKDGKMKFTNADLPSLLKEVRRWYNLEIRYEGPITTNRFTANISRDSNLSELLQILEGMGVHFSIQQQSGANVLVVKN